MGVGYADESLTEPEPTSAERSRAEMRKASEYRHHAEECRKLAAKMKTGDQRDHMLKIAKVWDQLAEERAEMLSKHPGLVQTAEKPLSA